MTRSALARASSIRRRPGLQCVGLGLGAVLVAFVSGCGTPDLVEVSGAATRGGQGVANLLLEFEPASGEGRGGFATTSADGRFAIRSQQGMEGIAPGEYYVIVDYRPTKPAPGQPAAPGVPKEIRAILTAHGRQSSRLSVTISEPTDDLLIELD